MIYSTLVITALLGLASAQVRTAATEKGSAAGDDIPYSEEWAEIAATQKGSSGGSDPVPSNELPPWSKSTSAIGNIINANNASAASNGGASVATSAQSGASSVGSASSSNVASTGESTSAKSSSNAAMSVSVAGGAVLVAIAALI